MPKYALAQVWTWIKNGQLDSSRLRDVRRASPLGRLLVVGLSNSKFGRAAMIESIELTAAQIVHELERYLETLGTIAAVTPLLGLLGTVVGMIRVFGQIMVVGTGDANALAGGISEALVSTAAGLCVAIPAYAAHRFFLRKVDALVLGLEQESLKACRRIAQRQNGRVKERRRVKFRQVRRELPALNLTPLIDIVFLLLIFFMVTTSFSRETRLPSVFARGVRQR